MPPEELQSSIGKQLKNPPDHSEGDRKVNNNSPTDRSEGDRKVNSNNQMTVNGRVTNPIDRIRYPAVNE